MRDRFALLIAHVQRQEEAAQRRLAVVRARLAAADARRAEADRAQVAAGDHAPLQRPQFLLFCRSCDLVRATAARDRAAALRDEQAVVAELTALLRRRRSFEHLQDRARRARAVAADRRSARAGDERAGRAWLDAPADQEVVA